MKTINQSDYDIIIIDQDDEAERTKLHESDRVLGEVNPDDLITRDVIYIVKKMT